MPSQYESFVLNEHQRTFLQTYLSLELKQHGPVLNEMHISAIETFLNTLFQFDQSNVNTLNRVSIIDYSIFDPISHHIGEAVRLISKLDRKSFDLLHNGLLLSLSNSFTLIDPDSNLTLTGREHEVSRMIRGLKLASQCFQHFVRRPKPSSQQPQDFMLYMTLDSICNELHRVNIIVKRSPDSRPFHFLFEAVSWVRPGIQEKNITSYLAKARQRQSGTDPNSARTWGDPSIERADIGLS